MDASDDVGVKSRAAEQATPANPDADRDPSASVVAPGDVAVIPSDGRMGWTMQRRMFIVMLELTSTLGCLHGSSRTMVAAFNGRAAAIPAGRRRRIQSDAQ